MFFYTFWGFFFHVLFFFFALLIFPSHSISDVVLSFQILSEVFKNKWINVTSLKNGAPSWKSRFGICDFVTFGSCELGEVISNTVWQTHFLLLFKTILIEFCTLILYVHMWINFYAQFILWFLSWFKWHSCVNRFRLFLALMVWDMHKLEGYYNTLLS